jgi:hypothetical protein
MNEPMSIQEIFPGAATELPEEDAFGFPKAPLNLTLGCPCPLKLIHNFC